MTPQQECLRSLSDAAFAWCCARLFTAEPLWHSVNLASYLLMQQSKRIAA